ncbi:c-type cytochrome [Massilia sp. S19_KUP03_FR1]|uniref:c-type cytochrome n=1 Tax=Massilia sp. S19_KUP03_FR1 TaxID=3025503 RepID=UPI002FCD7D17
MADQRKQQVRARENPDPEEMNRPVPWIVIALVLGVFIWAVAYIFINQRDDDPTLGDLRTISTLEEKVKSVSSANGAELYAANCAACHQASGAGVPGAFPPLAGSEWVAGQDRVLASILLHGITGSLTVKGTTYHGAMPSFKARFDDNQIAAILTFVRGNFGNAAAKVSPDVVKAEREASKDRSTPWNGDDDLTKFK